MAEIINRRDIPPGGWTYLERETGVWFEATSEEELIAKVGQHRLYKNLPIDNVRGLVEDQICLRLDGAFCRARPGEEYQPVPDLTQSLTVDMAAGANRALLEFLKGGMKFNEPAEASRRASICRTCPFNKPSSSCSCHAIYRMIEALIPAGRRHPGISVCMACGCSLQAKVNMPDSVVRASLKPGQILPPWCWQKSLQTLDDGSAS